MYRRKDTCDCYDESFTRSCDSLQKPFEFSKNIKMYDNDLDVKDDIRLITWELKQV